MKKVFPKIEFLNISDTDGDCFRLLEEIHFEWEGLKFTVPAGFESDGASVPQFLWASVSPKIDPRSLAGAIGHDFLYRECPEGWTRKMADDFFYDYLRLHGLSWWKSQKAYWGVRLFGGSSWQGDKENFIDVPSQVQTEEKEGFADDPIDEEEKTQ